ncbi:MAG: VWA domain-containing protein [Akkermansiaceae bacterium]|jgi:Ca-activated chloride channel homolog|nr:VWA domain-containing protein [Akkermansiaceae bacterium]
MSFAKPEWLLCLIALPLIGFMAWLSWRKRRYRWKRMVAPRLQGRLSHTRPPWVYFTSLGLALGGMTGLIIAIAQPESGEEWIEVENEGRNILFCVDISRSMLARDIEPNRLLASRAAALEILERFPNDRVGVLLFSGETLVQSPLTIDHSFVEQTLAQLDPNDIPVGGSNLTTAIDSGTRLLRETGQQSNIMVVFSDGEKSSEGLEEAAAGAAREGIFIYAIGIGTTEGSFIPDSRESDGNFRDRSGNVVFSKLNEEALQVIAEETDGYYSKGMGAGFIGKLDSALAEMDRFREEGKHQRVAKPAHRWFVFGGLLLIMASIFIKCLPLAPIVAMAAFILATPGAEAGLVEDGVAALKAGETTTAQQLFTEAAEETSGDRAASLYLASGSAASKAQDWPTAVASFSSALSTEDSEILQQAHYALATSLFYLGAPKAKEEKVKAWEGSIEHFKAALKIQPQDEASTDNLRSVEKQLAELQKEKEKKDEDKAQEKEDGNKDDSEKKDPEEEAQNDPNSQDTSDEPASDQSNENPDDDNEGDASKENSDDNQTNESKDGESEIDEKSEQSKPSDEQSNPNQNQSNEEESKQGTENKSQTENSSLKDDPNAPENETPRERARRLLKQYSDFGGKAPRRIRRPYNRNPHDW